MKRSLLLVVALCLFLGYRAAMKTLDDATPQGAVSVVDKARTSDGRIELAKLVDSPILPKERRAALKEADLDGDGFLTDEEFDNMPNLASAWREKALEKELAEAQDEQMRKMLFIAYSETQG